MHIQPSFWVKLRSLCTQHLEKEDPLRLQINGMIDQIPEYTRGDQHQMTADLFAMLGRLPNAVECGFRMGGRLPATTYGVLSLGILTAPTIGDALRFIANARNLQTPLINLSYEEVASEGRFTIGFRCPIDSAGESLIVAVCTAAIEREIARRSGRAGNFARLELTPSSKGSEAIYRKCLSLTPRTDSKSNKLIFRRAVLDLPNAHADVDTFNSVVHACMAQAEFQACEVPLQDRVRETIMSGIGAPPSQQRLAKILGLSPKQLRVRLDRECTSYQKIIRDCRTEYARALFKSPSLSLSEIADRLGYSDLSAFSHSFNRWTGKSPSDFRLEMRSQANRPEAERYALQTHNVMDHIRSPEAHPVAQPR